MKDNEREIRHKGELRKNTAKNVEKVLDLGEN